MVENPGLAARARPVPEMFLRAVQDYIERWGLAVAVLEGFQVIWAGTVTGVGYQRNRQCKEHQKDGRDSEKRTHLITSLFQGPNC
jgi:hypothetical protein